ncbi:MAG: hypothetical protein PHN69_03955 [Candidatus Pacebacteria bacterium]|nr:hypothetical protein [Candidatus Paceibacterota bacterium]
MKPILFNTEMVKVILEGRKTVTRRPIKLDLGLADTDKNDSSYLKIQDKYGDFHDAKDLCRYKVGDILYVRETWLRCDLVDESDNIIEKDTVLYKADEPNIPSWGTEEYKHYKWKPSIHMPKELARIFLKVTNVRVERLQDIKEEQAVAEGVKAYGSNNCSGTSARIAFAELWDEIEKTKYEWRANPYVWVIEFERLVIAQEG